MLTQESEEALPVVSPQAAPAAAQEPQSAVPAAVSPAPAPAAQAAVTAAASATEPTLADVFSPPERSTVEPAQAAAPAAAEVVPEAEAPPQEAAAEANGEEDDEPLPPPPAEPTGLIGIGAKMLSSKAAELAEHERVKNSVQYLKEKSKQVTESEKVQQSVQYVKDKTSQIAESERVQKGLEFAKDKAAVAKERATEVSQKVSEKTKAGVEFAKEKTQGLREGAITVWSSGRGKIERVRESVKSGAWKGSARDTLDIAAREEQWKGIKVQGAEELQVPARTEHTCCYHVSKGSTLRWTFRVKEHDIGFGVRMRVQEWGGSREDEVLAVERYDSSDTISGSWVADEDRTMVLVFDNRYSKLRAKTVAYFTGTEKPPVYVETPNTEAAASSEEQPSAAPTAAAPVAAEAPRAIV